MSALGWPKENTTNLRAVAVGVKQYLNKHQVEYQGICGENGIEGKWKLPFSSGPFHIWPRSMTHLNELYLRDEMPAGGPVGESIVDSMLLNTTSLEDII